MNRDRAWNCPKPQSASLSLSELESIVGVYALTSQSHLGNTDALAFSAANATNKVITNLGVSRVSCNRSQFDDIQATLRGCNHSHRPKMFIMTDAMYLAHSSRGTSRILLEGVRQAAAKLSVSPTVCLPVSLRLIDGKSQ